MTGGARGTITEVAPRASCRFLCIRPYNHFSLLLRPINRTLKG
jgi:hypothetical protein